MEDKTQIVTTTNEVRGSILSIDSEPYCILAMGSDIANLFAPDIKTLRDYERNHFLSFSSFVVLQREGFELLDAAQCAIQQRVTALKIHNSVTDLKGCFLREAWKKKEDIRRYLPEGVWEVIEPHVGKFKNQP